MKDALAKTILNQLTLNGVSGKQCKLALLKNCKIALQLIGMGCEKWYS